MDRPPRQGAAPIEGADKPADATEVPKAPVVKRVRKAVPPAAVEPKGEAKGE